MRRRASRGIAVAFALGGPPTEKRHREKGGSGCEGSGERKERGLCCLFIICTRIYILVVFFR